MKELLEQLLAEGANRSANAADLEYCTSRFKKNEETRNEEIASLRNSFNHGIAWVVGRLGLENGTEEGYSLLRQAMLAEHLCSYCHDDTPAVKSYLDDWVCLYHYQTRDKEWEDFDFEQEMQ